MVLRSIGDAVAPGHALPRLPARRALPSRDTSSLVRLHTHHCWATTRKEPCRMPAPLGLGKIIGLVALVAVLGAACSKSSTPSVTPTQGVGTTPPPVSGS